MVTRRFGVLDLDKFVEHYRPFSIGFDSMFDNLNTVGEIANNYPPYNIIKQDEEHYIIEIARHFDQMNSTFMLCQKVTNLLSKVFKIVGKIKKNIFTKVSVPETLHGLSL